MALRTFLRFVFVLNVIGTAIGTPCAQSVKVFSNNEFISVQNLSPCSTSVVIINGQTITVPPLSRAQRSLHKVAKRSTRTADDTQGRSASLAALQETGKLLRLATMLPAETLQVVRMVAVPLLNTTLGAPANLLEGVARMSMGEKLQETKEQANPSEGAAMSTYKESQGTKKQARSLSVDVLNTLALLHQKRFLLHKNITFGPFSLKKVIEFGKPTDEATTSPSEVVPATTPLPDEAVSVTAYPPVALSTPTPMDLVPTTTPPPMDLVPTTTPPPEAVVAEVTTPAPGSVVPAVPDQGSVVVVTAPQQPNVDSTNQVVIVQNSNSMDLVPATTPPSVASDPTTTPPPVAIVAEVTAPAPPSAMPLVAAPSSCAVVTAPQQPNVDSTNQVAIVQNSPPATDTSGHGI